MYPFTLQIKTVQHSFNGKYNMKNGLRKIVLSAKAAMTIGLFLYIGATIPSMSASSDAGVQTPEGNLEAEKTEEVSAQTASTGQIEDSVVRVFATIRRPDLTKPWTKQPGQEATGSGLVIEGQRILTNAHVVLYAGQIQVQGSQGGDKISASVEAIAPGIDLAVLKLSDESFFDSHEPLPRATVLPQVRDTVLVYGFPTGGNSISITKGIVSRIDFTHYNYPVSGLRVQIDAAINPGNSGGPAIVGDKVVGLAFSALSNAQNIGYIIPCEEIELFLEDIKDGHYDGKPAIFDEYQTLENPALRTFLKLDKSAEGIIVHEPFQDDKAYPLKQWDVVAKIGDTPIDNQGNIKLSENLKVLFTYLVQKISKNGTVSLTLVRAGKEISIRLPVSPDRPKLLPYLQGTYPSYFICGPLVFSTASMDMVSSFPNASNLLIRRDSPLISRQWAPPAFEGEELVVIPAPFFTHALANNYSSPQLRVVKTVNGIAVKNLRHLVKIIRDLKDEFVVIEFAGQAAETLVFLRKELIASTEDVLNDSGIRNQGSPDMMAVWDQ
jgi:S1-C subfamily serine protease